MLMIIWATHIQPHRGGWIWPG